MRQSPSMTHNAYAAPPPQDASDFLVPASMTSPPPPPPFSATSPTASRPARKARHAMTSNQAFDEYFEESAQKSKEVDYAPPAKATPPPPPPRSGGAPPRAPSPAMAHSPAPADEEDNNP